MNTSLKIGLLDFGLRTATMNSLVKLDDVFHYVARADELGFSRYWIAEHYFTTHRLAWNNPVPLIPILAMQTSRIRIGTGGILLRLHNPLHIAESFKLYNNIFSNRIDLGFANGGSFSDEVLRLTKAEDVDFDASYREVLHLLRNEYEYFDRGIVLPPFGGLLPEFWSMSSSMHGCGRALTLRTNFVRSLFHSGADLLPQRELLADFRASFFRQHNSYPTVAVAISGCCQHTEQKARQIFDGLTLDPALHIVGSAEFFHDKVCQLAEDFGVTEIIFKDIAKEPGDRMETLSLISEKFGLATQSAAALPTLQPDPTPGYEPI